MFWCLGTSAWMSSRLCSFTYSALPRVYCIPSSRKISTIRPTFLSAFQSGFRYIMAGWSILVEPFHEEYFWSLCIRSSRFVRNYDQRPVFGPVDWYEHVFLGDQVYSFMVLCHIHCTLLSRLVYSLDMLCCMVIMFLASVLIFNNRSSKASQKYVLKSCTFLEVYYRIVEESIWR